MPGARKRTPTAVELEFLHVLWSKGEATTEDVMSALADEGRPLADGTVRKMLSILMDKGFVTRRKQGRGYVYRPTVGREQAGRLPVAVDEITGDAAVIQPSLERRVGERAKPCRSARNPQVGAEEKPRGVERVSAEPSRRAEQNVSEAVFDLRSALYRGKLNVEAHLDPRSRAHGETPREKRGVPLAEVTLGLTDEKRARRIGPGEE